MKKQKAPAAPVQMRSVDEAAVILNVCRSTVNNAIRAGQLRSVKWRGRRLIPDDVLREIAEAE